MPSRDPFLRKLNSMMGDVLADLEAERRLREVDAARKDPAKHAACLVFPDGLRYLRWPDVWRSKNVAVRWCYTTRRNAAGRYLVFREVIKHKAVKVGGRSRKVRESGKRDNFRPFVSRSSAAEQARLAWEAEKARRQDR